MLATHVAPQRESHTKTTVIWTIDTDQSGVNQLAFETDGKTLISVYSKIKKWDVATGKLKSTSQKQGNSWQQYSADGKYYVYGVSERRGRKVDVWKVNLHDAQSDALLHTFKIPGGDVNLDYQAVFSNKSTQLNLNYTRTQKHPKTRQNTYTDVFTVWDMQSGKQIKSHVRFVTEDADPFFNNSWRQYYQDPIFSPDNKQLWLLESAPEVITEPRNSNVPLKVHLTDMLRDKRTATFSVPPEKNKYSLRQMFSNKWIFLCASPKKSLIAAVRNSGISVSEDAILYGFNVKTQQTLWSLEANGLYTQALAFSPDGKFLAWGGRDFERKSATGYYPPGKLLLLDPATGKTIAEVTERTLNDLAKQKPIEIATRLGRVFGLKRVSNKEPKSLPGETPDVNSLAFSPDSKKLAVGYADGSIKLWKIQ